MFKMRSRQIVILSMVVVISFAVFLNWNLNRSALQTDTMPDDNKNFGEAELVGNEDTGADLISEVFNKSNYFDEAKLNRQKSRDEMLDVLKEMAADSANTEAVRKKASEDMLTMALNIEKETVIENMIKAKGFANCVVTLNTTSANIVVKSSGMQPNEAAQINEIVMSQTGFRGDNIKIVEIN